MCGFVGIARRPGHEPGIEETAAFFDRAGPLLAHRGPDDETRHLTDHLSVLFRRLSIVDVEGGRQPIANDDQSVICWVNGEIYNHQALRAELGDLTYASDSDAAVIPYLYARYGERLVDRLEGIFAICLWDQERKKLLLYRDRLGVKPLYFATTPSGVLFGSELKALLSHPECPREVNFHHVAQDIAADVTPVATYVGGIEHVPGGHMMIVEAGQLSSPTPYWRFQDHLWNPSQPAQSSDDYRTTFRALLKQCVEQRLMADVPVGLALSGGVDSSLVTAILAGKQDELLTFNVVERSTVTCGDAATAAQVAANCEATHRALYFDPGVYGKTFGLSTFELMIGLIESPRFDLEWFFKYKLYGLARKLVPALKVVILGQGADEFAGGYSNEGGRANADWSAYLTERVEPKLRESLAKEVLAGPNLAGYVDASSYPHDCDYVLSSYQQKMIRHTHQLQHFNLWLEDRASAFVGVEARVPFLDHRIVEFLASIPPAQHAELFWDKAIVRDALEANLPSYPEHRPKIGFFDSDDRSGVDYIVASVLNNSFEAFLRKYEDEIAEIFDADQLWQRFQSDCANQVGASSTTYELLGIMASVCFQALVTDPSAYMSAALDETPDPEVLDGVSAASLRKLIDQEATPWAMSISPASQYRLADAVRFLTGLESAEADRFAVSILRNGSVESEFSADHGNRWILGFLTELQRLATGFSLQGICDSLQLRPEQVAPLFANLIQQRFIVRAAN